MNNTADSNYPYGKWKITHDYQYYENHIGQFSESGKYIDDFINIFDKTGRYEISYEDNPVNPENIYVHRRPTAEIAITRSGNNITLTSNSYDLDSYSQGNRGISEEQWEYKKETDTTWTSGKLTTITGTDDYIVQLRVKDYQNTWSNPVSIYITNSANALPVASFSLQNDTITLYEDLEIIDSSYDPAGWTITSRSWEVYKGSSRIYSGANPPTSYRSYGTGDYNIYLTVTNNRGKVSERFGRTFTVIEDEIPPEVVVTPTESDWTESITVHLEFSDQGGSQFKSYQYAITDSQALPSSWSSAIAKQTDDIVINQEGLKYLHIIATDNAGNASDDRVVGPYRIDRSNPTIEYTGDLTNIQIDYVDLTLTAKDTWSGVSSFTVNGQEIQNGTHRFTKNGIYTLIAKDKINHTTTRQIEITNIYYECNAGLEHPIYSSSYAKCPICSSYEGLVITEDSHVYNSEPQGLKYNNPNNASIVEYYNESTEKPELAGDYSYELKVIYQGQEYRTPYTGTYHITKKPITITDIVAQSKIYNGNTEVVLTGGRLLDVCEGDEVIFVLPYLGNTESKNVGTWNVIIEEIKLEGEHAPNYQLTQPDLESVTATITQRLLTIVNIEGKNKIYDGSTTVEIEGGELVGLIEHDDIEFIVPEYGEAESANVGTWSVTIEDIQVQGTDAPNYRFIQPGQGDIQVVISKEIGEIIIGCDNKKYDRYSIQPYVVEKNSTSEPEYHYYISGTDEEIEAPYDIGVYDVVAFIPTDGNYTEATSNRVTFEITVPDSPTLKLTSEIININGEDTNNIVRENQDVKYGDIIKIQFKIENIGEGSGYAQNIISHLPDGVTFLPENEINMQNGWKQTENGTIETSALSLENNIDNEIFSIKQNNETQEDSEETSEKATYKEIELVLEITTYEKEDLILLQNTEIIQQDKRGDIREYSEEQKQYQQSQVGMNLKYVDLELQKLITQIIQTGEKKKYDIFQQPDEIVKLELEPKKIGQIELEVIYQLKITNKGNEVGILESITDVLPNGMTFETVDNQGWKINQIGNIVYQNEEKILPNETKTVELKLKYEVTEDNMATKINTAILQASDDLDQILLDEGITSEIDENNNESTSELVLSVITGKMIIIFIILTMMILTIVILGVSAIKKFVLIKK